VFPQQAQQPLPVGVAGQRPGAGRGRRRGCPWHS
jgi:hypothetical protein